MIDVLCRRWPDVVLKDLEYEEPMWEMTTDDAADLGMRRRGVEPLRMLVMPQRITRVTVAPGASNPRHVHASSEQVWVALRGNAQLLLDGSTTTPFGEGDVVRFIDGDVHGLENLGAEEFVYLSVTSPPINFRAAYPADWRKSEGGNAA